MAPRPPNADMPNTDPPNTDTQLILRHWQDSVPDDRLAHLIRDAGRSLGHRLAPLLAAHDIPFGHWVFLRVLWDGDGLTQKELSDAAGVTEPTTFAAVKALIGKGYVTRRHNPGNRRKFYVYLTADGAALRDILVPMAEEVNRIAVDGIPPENLGILRDSLLQMITNLAAGDGAETAT